MVLGVERYSRSLARGEGRAEFDGGVEFGRGHAQLWYGTEQGAALPYLRRACFAE